MEDKRVIIIAEAGVNHNGDLNIAKKMIEIAAECGVDFIKFQTFKAENLVTKSAEMAQYQADNIGEVNSQYSMLKKLELSEIDFINLKKHAEFKKIKFFSTGFDLESLEFLKKIEMGLWKIPSGEITNLPYLEFIGKCNLPVILSTGMSTIDEIENAISILVKSGTSKNKITVLHCNTDYPTKFEDVHLRALETMRNHFKVDIGYSDHTPGVEVSVAAVALGATVIEKHFTLDKNMIGPDHKASIDPSELKNLVTQIRNIEKALGRSEKIPTLNESKNIAIARKSIVAKKNIRKGEYFTTENLTTKRPGNGISPMKWYEVVGNIAEKNYEVDDII